MNRRQYRKLVLGVDEEPKIHIEKLTEDAWKWFKRLNKSEADNMIIAAYMKEKKIKGANVDW